MAVSRKEIASLSHDLFRDSVFDTPVDPYIDFAIDRLNRERPRIQVSNHTVVAADIASDDGTVFALPNGFDIARDKILSIEDLDTDNTREIPGVFITDWMLYQVDTDTVKIQILTVYEADRVLRIKWRGTYTFSDSSSNIPDSLARPLALLTSYYHINAVVAKLAQARREGGDEIGFTAQMTNVRELGKLYLEEYNGFIKELAPAPVGVVPANTAESMPSRMGRIIR